MTEKDKKIIEDSERLGIPIFVLTAKDQNALAAISFYRNKCEEAGCNESHVEGINKRIFEFAEWTGRNISLMKLPD